jgi:hypothetical protein
MSQFTRPRQSMHENNAFPDTVNRDLKFASKSGTGVASHANARPAGGHMTSKAFGTYLYAQNPATMTPSRAHENRGLASYMPSTAGMTADGKDPDTGLPVFTAEKLMRAHALNSTGRRGFLRKESSRDDGRRRLIGASMHPQRDRRIAELARAQYAAAKVPGQDLVHFNTSSFMLQ